MMKTRFIFLFAAIVLALSVGCGSKKTIKEAETGEHADEHENTNTATLTKKQIASIGIQTGSIEQKQLTRSLKANGVLQVPNQNKASVNSVYTGTIQSLLIQPGNTVTKGQLIATVSNPEFIRTQEDLLSVNAEITLAEQEYARQKELNEGNAGALKNLQAADARLRALRTRRASLAQQVQLMGINPATLSDKRLVSILSIRSPISGVVSAVTVRIGSYVDVNTPVAEIVDNSQLHLDLFIYEKDLPKLRENQTIHFTLTNNPGREYDAGIYSLGSSFEGESKAVSVHARVKGDKNGLIDGMNITAVISLEKQTVPAVPSEAIVTYQGQDYIFIVTDPHPDAGPREEGVTFEKIPVAKGTTDVGYTEITLLKEIPANPEIVVKGAFFVLAKMTNEGEGEHGH